MAIVFDPTSDVFTFEEVARAAGADVAHLRALVDDGRITTCSRRYFSCREAVHAVVELRRGAADIRRALFAPPQQGVRQPAVPFIASGGVHLAIAAALALVTTVGVTGRSQLARPLQTRLVFLVAPGPGGGGGGGGTREPKPAQKAQLKGSSALRSPVVVRRREPAPKRETPPRTVEPPAPVPRPAEAPADPAPPPPAPVVTAPVASVAADPENRPGALDDAPPPSQGPGSNGGSGTGSGTGIGEGSGPGIGPGSGGGTGGGPFRPGSGVTPPRLLHEVKPDYTEEARRRGLSGEVVLEVVVQRDGRVGSVRVIQGLGSGLDRRAIDAVRQWRFAPGERLGTPVDVVVEVAVEFRLR
jgi:TonB family protein